MNAIDQLEKYILLLREFGELPVIVLVMILDDQRDAAFGGVRNAGLDALSGVSNALGAAHLRTALAAQHAAERSAERRGHVDPPFFEVDLLLPKSRLRMREIRRAAHHRHRQVVVLQDAAER